MGRVPVRPRAGGRTGGRKNYYVETADEVADRIRAALEYVQPEKLTIVPDSGFSQTVRWAAKAKLKSMVEGAKIVRRELAG